MSNNHLKTLMNKRKMQKFIWKCLKI